MATDPVSNEKIEELAQHYGVSREAVKTLLQALTAGRGTMAQFSHPDLGGAGQWSQGGMIMIGDMFNDTLKAKVAELCYELSGLLRQEASGQEAVSLSIPATEASSENWWGSDLGQVTAGGSQNNIRYAYFSAAHRLAIRIGAKVTIYDTEDHEIGGVSQQQSGDASLTFVSQHGLVSIDELRVVSQNG